MIPGPDVLYQCPKCNNYIYNESIMSGNTCGSLLYSDGKSFAPMLPEFPNLTKCKVCGEFLWLQKMKAIGYFGLSCDNMLSDLIPDTGKVPDKAEFLTMDEYFEALRNNAASAKKDEVFIRIRILWAFNDRLRSGEEIFLDDNDEIRYLDNLAELINLLDENNLDEKISLAEVYRNLGDFDKCVDIIESIDDSEMEWLKVAFLKACEEKYKLVIRLR